MFLLILTVLFPNPSPAQPMVTGSLECKAIYKTVELVNGKEKFIEDEAIMPITFAVGTLVKYELSLGGKHYSVDEDKKEQSLLAFITTAPDYTKGSVTRGNTDANGVFNFSTVDGFTVHRMECRRLPDVKPPRLGL
jgi:hypothetical protein